MNSMHRLIDRLLRTIGLELHESRFGFWINMANLDPDFVRLYEKHKSESLVKPSRLRTIHSFAHYASALAGSFAQVGVYKGGSAAFIADCIAGSGKRFHLFDTFEGLPSSELPYEKQDRRPFTDTSLEMVQKRLSEFDFIQFHKGFFPETAKPVIGEKFCFVYLDADLYQSIKDGLNFFLPRLVDGGVVVIDDYGSNNWKGVEKAVTEFVAEYPIKLVPMRLASVQAVIIKPGQSALR
jgi:O-methyltransferase